MKISEIDLTRKNKVILRKGLKIVHSPTGLEYTVLDVFKDSSGKVKIKLAPPEQPRVEPITSTTVMQEVELVNNTQDDQTIHTTPEDTAEEVIDLEDEDVLVLDQGELKDYEVR